MARAFGTDLRTVVLPDLEGGWPAAHDFLEPHIRRFLEDIERIYGRRSSAPEPGDQT